TSLTRAEATQSRSPGVSSTAFRAQSPNLRLAPLMDMDFAVSCPLVRHWRLVSGFCPSTHTKTKAGEIPKEKSTLSHIVLHSDHQFRGRGRAVLRSSLSSAPPRYAPYQTTGVEAAC